MHDVTVDSEGWRCKPTRVERSKDRGAQEELLTRARWTKSAMTVRALSVARVAGQILTRSGPGDESEAFASRLLLPFTRANEAGDVDVGIVERPERYGRWDRGAGVN